MLFPYLRMLAGATSCILALAGTAAHAADTTYPERPVTIVLPYPPGGMSDVLARGLAKEMSVRWSQPVIVDNRPGASGRIGARYVANSKPDGYTLLVGISQMVQAPAMYDDIPYDVSTDFTPLSHLANATAVLVTAKGSGIDSLGDYITQAKAVPGAVTYGSTGAGTSSHIYSEIFNRRAGISTLHVPFKGNVEALTSILAGHVSAGFIDLATALPHIREGKLNVFAVSGQQRAAVLPETPTFEELGYPTLTISGWYGLFGPAGMPTNVVAEIAAAAADAIRSAAMQEMLAKAALQPVGSEANELETLVAHDLRMWQAIVDETGIKAE